MTLAQFQTRVHYLLKGDTDVPTAGDDEYTLRTELLSDVIDSWNGEEGILWNELFVQLSTSATGDKTILAATTSYDCPTDFSFLGGVVELTNGSTTTRVDVIKPQDAGLYTTSDQKCYITGNANTGFQINFTFQPTVGDTINYPYYKTPLKPSSAGDIIEMSDPTFAVQSVLQILLEHAGAGDRANLALAKASAKLQSMRTKNIMPTWYESSAIPDRDYSNGDVGFGR
jgi:hypothetical protein